MMDDSDGGVQIDTISDQVTSLGFLGTSSYSIISIYIGIVWTIGTVVRAIFTDPPYNIPHTEMRQPDDLLELCEGIYLARLETYDGHLADEVRLYDILINVFRSPEMLL